MAAKSFLIFLSLLLFCSTLALSFETDNECIEKQYGQQEGFKVQLQHHKEVGFSTNPYFWPWNKYTYLCKCEYGQFRLAPRFYPQYESSYEAFDYRLAVFEANPNTFRVPYHWNADSVFYVVQGNAILSLVRFGSRQAIFVKQGDIFRIPAGTSVYWINRSTSEKLRVVKLFKPLSRFGNLVGFSGVWGHSGSVLQSFSSGILTSAFNVTTEKYFSAQQVRGSFLQASQQQLIEISKCTESRQTIKELAPRPFNLLVKKPIYANQYGQVYIANPADYSHLQNLDVSFFNMVKGSMLLPLYYSKATRIVYVVQGSGHFEMVRPDFSVQEEQEIRYQNVRSNISPGDMFIIPAGFPFSAVAAANEDLQFLSFGIDVQDNELNFLVGKNNIYNYVDSWAKELTFGCAAKEVETLFSAQKDAFFIPSAGCSPFSRQA